MPHKNIRLWTVLPAALIFGTYVVSPSLGQSDVADIKTQDLRAGSDPQKRYLLIGPKPGIEVPQEGFGLLVVMPGGTGSARFQSFVKRILKNALPDDYLVAQPVAVKWTSGQKIVWPTRTNRVPRQEFTTEEFVEGVIQDVKAKHKVDPHRIFNLAWSSAGPAAYAISLQEKKSIAGSYIAMSVFKPSTLPRLEAARGHAYFLDHSPTDNVCPFRDAQEARDQLTKYGARVKLVTYDGGHGWHGDMWNRISRGIAWLENDQSPIVLDSARKQENLLQNGGFEAGSSGTRGWMLINNSGSTRFEVDRNVKLEGEQSLRISKSGGPPIDVLRYNLTGLPGGGKVSVSAMIKARSVRNAWFKLFLYDASEQSLLEDVDVSPIRGTFDWKRFERTFDVPKETKSGAVMFVIVLDGTAWIDDIRVTPVGR